MSKSTHQIQVTGVDHTSAAFQSIQARAIAAGNRITRVMGGAIAAAGAYLSFRSIKGGVDELGRLSDLAMHAGASVAELTRASLAFQVAGLNLPVESLAKAFQHLRKQTGEGGMEAFFAAARGIAQIDDAAERGAALVRTFGRSGLELQPLIDGGDAAISKMRTLAEVMPGVSDAAANAGDAAADSLKIFGSGVNSLFLKVIGNIIGLWSDEFPGGVRAGALSAINYLETFLKKANAMIAKWGSNMLASFAWWKDLFSEGYDAANRNFAGTTNLAEEDYRARMEAADAARREYTAKLKELSVDDLAGAFGSGRSGAAANVAEAATTAAVEAAARITNQMISGGSNAAQRLSILGPEYRNEQKKQTELLRDIAKNTAKTADNTDDGESYAVTDLGA